VPRTPHDTLRLGLPAAALARIVEEPEARDALLAAAALLLAGAALGGCVVGIAARRLARAA